jgi:hypothetical protein
LICGAVITIFCGGAKLWKRIVTAAVSGALIGMLSISTEVMINYSDKVTILRLLSLLMISSRYAFIFALLCTIGAIVTELMLPDPDLSR